MKGFKINHTQTHAYTYINTYTHTALLQGTRQGDSLETDHWRTRRASEEKRTKKYTISIPSSPKAAAEHTYRQDNGAPL
jgi:hypothetical protein